MLERTMPDSHPLLRLERLVLIAIGGFLGANSRYVIGTIVPGLPGTFIANTLGSFILGFILYEALYTGLLSEKARLVFTTGFLSSFTTYSTFALESVQVPLVLGTLNIVGSYSFGFAGVLAGRRLAARIKEE